MHVGNNLQLTVVSISNLSIATKTMPSNKNNRNSHIKNLNNHQKVYTFGIFVVEYVHTKHKLYMIECLTRANFNCIQFGVIINHTRV